MVGGIRVVNRMWNLPLDCNSAGRITDGLGRGDAEHCKCPRFCR